jgi:hypothetical protein
LGSTVRKLRLAAGLALAFGLLVPQAALGAGAGSFASTGSMGAPRYAAVAAPLPDGRVLVAGGYYDDGGDHYLASAEVFNPATNAFSSAGIGAMGTARTGAVAAPLPDGRVLVAGGFDGSTRFSSAEIFAATNSFTFRVKGKKLIVSVQASGKVSVRDAKATLSASAAKKKQRKRKRLLNASGASGDPPTIKVQLRLTRLAKQKLRRKGKVTVRARITFAPQGGLANTRTAKLKIKSKKKK